MPKNHRRSPSSSRSRSRSSRHHQHHKSPPKPIAPRKRESKWSDKPPEKVSEPQTNILFDSGIIKIDAGQSIPSSAITISNPGGVNFSISNPLQNSQKELFSKLLEKKEEEILKPGLNLNNEIFTINPNFGVDMSAPMNHNTAILAQAGIQLCEDKMGNMGGMGGGLGLMSILNPLSAFGGMNSTGMFKHTPGINPNIINTLNDPSKIKRKIYVPQSSNFNFTGLIIGPKGANQKRLEEETGCKILVRGKGSQKEGQVPQPDDNEPQHVLVVGDNDMQVSKAVVEIERIIFADEETRNKLRQEQLKIVAQLKNEPNVNLPLIPLSEDTSFKVDFKVDLSLTTPYGPPSPDAYVIPVPNDCVGLVIGKGGDTIKMLQVNSGARKVQVAADSNPNSSTRNVFVEGDRESINRVKKMLQDIIDTQQKLKNALGGGGGKSTKMDVPVPDNLVGLIIGRGGETIRNINHKTGAFVFIPKACEPGSNVRVLVVSGLPEQIEMAKNEIDEIVNMGQKNLAMKAAQMYPPTAPIAPFPNYGAPLPYMDEKGGNLDQKSDQNKSQVDQNMGPNLMYGQPQYPMDMNNMMMGGMPNMYNPMFDPNLLASYQQQMAENQLVITDVVDEPPVKLRGQRKYK